MLLNEQFNFDDAISVRKKLKGMASDLRDQAETSTPVIGMELNDDPYKFRVVLSGGLDLFTGEGACPEPKCRVANSLQVARSIALMADHVTLHDYMGLAFRELPRRPKNEDLFKLVGDVYILRLLKPLIEAGVVQFVSTSMPACSSCIAEFESRVNQTTDTVLKEFRDSFVVERREDLAAVESDALYTPPIYYRVGRKVADKFSDEDLIRMRVHKCVRTAMWDAFDAATVSGSVFSNSAVGLSGLMSQEGRT